MTPPLLIAGAGYLGSEIARQAGDDRVVTVTKSGGGPHEACDLASPEQVASLARKFAAPDVVIHCASSGRGGPEAYRDIFIRGSQNLARAFPDSHLILTSSTSVYHQTDGSEVDESSPTQPIRETSQLLLEAEQIILKAGGTVARLAGLYGPGRSVILRKFLEGTAVIEEDGRRILNQIHVEDAASAVLYLASQKAAGLFNVSDDRPLSQRECYEGLAEHFQRPLPPTGEKNVSRKRAWTHKAVLNAKIRATGWHPRFPCFFDALDQLAATP